MAVAVSVKARGGTVGLLGALLCDTSNKLGVSFRERSGSWQSVELDRLWHKASLFLAASTAVSPSVAWHEAAAAQVRTGKSGVSELAVIECFAQRGLSCHTDLIAFALDELAVTAGVSRTTARAVTRRLVDSGWLAVKDKPSATAATLWALTIPADSQPACAPAPNASPSGFLDIPLGSDAGRQGSVGKAPLRVLRLVEAAGPDGITAQDAAAVLGVTAQTVRRHLGVLSSFALVVQQDNPSPTRQRTRWRRGEGSLQSAAEVSGTAGAELRDRRALAAKRRERKAFLAAGRAGCGTPTTR
jgi:DNA-binding MarR family transcriptional regulator